MSTIHNPSQFQPQDYRVEDYIDNKPPEYTGGTVEHFALRRKAWEADLLSCFPDRNAYKCQHCGNGNVRYVAACTHIPTGERICFGADCVARLAFQDAKQFQLAQIKSRAAAGHARMKIWLSRCRFVEEHPEIETFRSQLENAVHSKNYFVRDILAKLDQYGDLSERQLAAIGPSLQRDIDFAAREAAKPILPALAEGRQVVEGKIISFKTIPNQFSRYGSTKMLVELSTGHRIFGGAPMAIDLNPGDKVRFAAQISPSPTDASFGFFKRPTKVEILTA